MKHSPIGCSVSKSPNLLRNTFSVEMYGEFLKLKNKSKNGNQAEEQKSDNDHIKVEDTDRQ